MSGFPSIRNGVMVVVDASKILYGAEQYHVHNVAKILSSNVGTSQGGHQERRATVAEALHRELFHVAWGCSGVLNRRNSLCLANADDIHQNPGNALRALLMLPCEDVIVWRTIDSCLQCLDSDRCESVKLVVTTELRLWLVKLADVPAPFPDFERVLSLLSRFCALIADRLIVNRGSNQSLPSQELLQLFALAGALGERIQSLASGKDEENPLLSPCRSKNTKSFLDDLLDRLLVGRVDGIDQPPERKPPSCSEDTKRRAQVNSTSEGIISARESRDGGMPVLRSGAIKALFQLFALSSETNHIFSRAFLRERHWEGLRRLVVQEIQVLCVGEDTSGRSRLEEWLQLLLSTLRRDPVSSNASSTPPERLEEGTHVIMEECSSPKSIHQSAEPPCWDPILLLAYEAGLRSKDPQLVALVESSLLEEFSTKASLLAIAKFVHTVENAGKTIGKVNAPLLATWKKANMLVLVLYALKCRRAGEGNMMGNEPALTGEVRCAKENVKISDVARLTVEALMAISALSSRSTETGSFQKLFGDHLDPENKPHEVSLQHMMEDLGPDEVHHLREGRIEKGISTDARNLESCLALVHSCLSRYPSKHPLSGRNNTNQVVSMWKHAAAELETHGSHDALKHEVSGASLMALAFNCVAFLNLPSYRLPLMSAVPKSFSCHSSSMGKSKTWILMNLSLFVRSMRSFEKATVSATVDRMVDIVIDHLLHDPSQHPKKTGGFDQLEVIRALGFLQEVRHRLYQVAHDLLHYPYGVHSVISPDRMTGTVGGKSARSLQQLAIDVSCILLTTATEREDVLTMKALTTVQDIIVLNQPTISSTIRLALYHTLIQSLDRWGLQPWIRHGLTHAAVTHLLGFFMSRSESGEEDDVAFRIDDSCYSAGFELHRRIAVRSNSRLSASFCLWAQDEVADLIDFIIRLESVDREFDERFGSWLVDLICGNNHRNSKKGTSEDVTSSVKGCISAVVELLRRSDEGDFDASIENDTVCLTTSRFQPERGATPERYREQIRGLERIFWEDQTVASHTIDATLVQPAWLSAEHLLDFGERPLMVTLRNSTVLLSSLSTLLIEYLLRTAKEACDSLLSAVSCLARWKRNLAENIGYASGCRLAEMPVRSAVRFVDLAADGFKSFFPSSDLGHDVRVEDDKLTSLLTAVTDCCGVIKKWYSEEENLSPSDCPPSQNGRFWARAVQTLWKLYQAIGSEEVSRCLVNHFERASLADPLACLSEGVRRGEFESEDDIDIFVRNTRFAVLSALRLSICLPDESSSSQAEEMITSLQDGFKSRSGEDGHVSGPSILLKIARDLCSELYRGLHGSSGGLSQELYDGFVHCIERFLLLYESLSDKLIAEPYDRHGTSAGTDIEVCLSGRMILWKLLSKFTVEQPKLLKTTLMVAVWLWPSTQTRIVKIHAAAENKITTGGENQTRAGSLLGLAMRQCRQALQEWFRCQATDAKDCIWSKGIDKKESEDEALDDDSGSFGIDDDNDCAQHQIECNNEKASANILMPSPLSWSLTCDCVLTAAEKTWKQSPDLFQASPVTLEGLRLSVRAKERLPASSSVDFSRRRYQELRQVLLGTEEWLAPLSLREEESPQRQQNSPSVLGSQLLPPYLKLLFCALIERIAMTLRESLGVLVRIVRHSKGQDGREMEYSCREPSLLALAEAAAAIAAWISPSARNPSDDSVVYDDFAVATRKWYHAEGKQWAIHKESRRHHTEDDKVLCRLPKVLFRLEQTEAELQRAFDFANTFRKSSTFSQEKASTLSVFEALLANNMHWVETKMEKTPQTEKTGDFLCRVIQGHIERSTTSTSNSGLSDDSGMALLSSTRVGAEVDNIGNCAQNEDKSCAAEILSSGGPMGKEVRSSSFGPKLKRSWHLTSSARHQIKRARRYPILRSRNEIVDEWLGLDNVEDGVGSGADAFVDLEDFLVEG